MRNHCSWQRATTEKQQKGVLANIAPGSEGES